MPYYGTVSRSVCVLKFSFRKGYGLQHASMYSPRFWDNGLGLLSQYMGSASHRSAIWLPQPRSAL